MRRNPKRRFRPTGPSGCRRAAPSPRRRRRPGAGGRRSSSRCPAPPAGTPRSRWHGPKASGSPRSGPSGTAARCARPAERSPYPAPSRRPGSPRRPPMPKCRVWVKMDLPPRHGTIAPSSQMSPSRSAIVIASYPPGIGAMRPARPPPRRILHHRFDTGHTTPAARDRQVPPAAPAPHSASRGRIRPLARPGRKRRPSAHWDL